MMWTLIGGSVADRAFDFSLIVAVGVTLLSGLAWAVSIGLSRKPATRHLILSSALICCLGMPVLAAAFTASGWTLIRIPLLPGDATRDVVTLAPDSPRPASDRLKTSPEGQALRLDRPGTAPEPIGPARVVATADRDSRKPTATFAARPGPLPLRVEAGRREAGDRVGSPGPYRVAAALALIGWGSGSLLLLLGVWRSGSEIRRLRRSARPLRDGSLRLVLEDVCRALRVQRPPPVVVSRRATTPFAVGFRSPIVVLPERLIGAVDGDQMRDVLVHEVAHVLRGDHRAVLLQEVARALYWPIVPVHGLIRELGRAREELCDNHVLQGRDALSYGETLLHLAELSLQTQAPRASVGILHWKGELELRIAGLLDRRRNTMTRSSRSLACIVTLLFVSCGTIASATRFIAASGEEDVQPAKVHGSAAKTPDRAKVAAEAKPSQEAKRSMLVHVIGPDGRPMPGVEVHRSVWTRPPSKGNIRIVSDERGEARFEIPANIDIYRIWARAKGYIPLFAHWEQQDNPEETLPKEFTFRLTRGTVIGGLIRDEGGNPIAGATVEVMLNRGGKSDGRTSPDMWLTDRGTTSITDAQGRWTLDNVPAGDDLELLLKLDHPDYIADANWGTLQKEQGVDLKALRARTAAITMRGGLSVSGTITDPEGKPVVGAVVVRGDRPYWEVGSQEVRTDDQGVYKLPPLPRGAQTITVVARGWMPALKKVEVTPRMKPVDFRLEPGKELRLRFVDHSGKPVPEVYVGIDKWRGGESLYNHRHPNVLDTQIPINADANGSYLWSWAPGDAVSYRIGKQGYAELKVDLTADGREQTVTLPKVLRISGTVTDATTAMPVERVTAIPVLEFAPGRLLVERQRAKHSPGPGYTIECDRTDVAYRVRVEAEGYRTAMSDAVRAGDPDPKFDFRLQPASPARGRVVDPQGRPVEGARVYLATPSQNLAIEQDNENAWPSNQAVRTDGQGGFSFPAQFEPNAIIAIHDRGYAEAHLQPGQQPGDLELKAWARVGGRLLQEGKPVSEASIRFNPLRPRLVGEPHIQDDFSVKTDNNGLFAFPRVPPVKASVSPSLSVWRDFPITSSHSVPLHLQPGERVKIDLGGNGTTVTGQVVLGGKSAATIDLPKSLNWLLRKVPGIEPPAQLRSLGFDARGGWNNAWISTPEGMAYLETLDHDFVKLDRAGRFRISGVPAGDYDFAIRLYNPPAGNCLVSPVGSKIVRFHVTEEAARGAAFDLGAIEVKVAPQPQLGEAAPDFATTTLAGETVKLGDFRGRYVLLDFWATWCASCVSDLPALRRLHDAYGAGGRLVVLGLNLDEDPEKAKRFVENAKLPWAHGSLGGQPDNPILTQYAVGSVPTYVLIGPDGKLIQSGINIEEFGEIVRRELK